MATELPGIEWHAGEKEIHRLLGLPERSNPLRPFLTTNSVNVVNHAPLLAIGTLDEQGRPWASLWGGESSFIRSTGQSLITVEAVVDSRNDPVLSVLLGKDTTEGEIKPGQMICGLGIDPENRDRAKLFGRIISGSVKATEDGLGQVLIVATVEQSTGLCPKYINKKHIKTTLPKPNLLSNDLPLCHEAIDLLERTDLFFISTSRFDKDMDCNNRGGTPGFVRVLCNSTSEGCVLVYPEYSGNRLYHTLGNLAVNPKAGIVVPDFILGNVLYLTGKTDILLGEACEKILPHAKLAIKFTVERAVFVSNGLSVRGEAMTNSPYNPPVWLLATEKQTTAPVHSVSDVVAKLISSKLITRTVACFEFALVCDGKPAQMSWKAGQYVMLGFAKQLGAGYYHMREDDPQSLNEDYLRTFTVSSVPTDNGKFEITIRNVGRITRWLLEYATETYKPLELEVKAFGGEFFITQQEDTQDEIAFIAGGVGITPLIAHVGSLDMSRVRLFWTIRAEDLGLADYIFNRHPELAKKTDLFITGITEGVTETRITDLQRTARTVRLGRMKSADLLADNYAEKRWYICAGDALRETAMGWLAGVTVIYESFAYLMRNIETVNS